jgi:glycosyltransferase involved in cell wall biosynthesis
MNRPSTQSKLPELSVLISTYNDRGFVGKKLLEIRAQTVFERTEFIFIDPNSPGGERELLEPFCEKYSNCRLITLNEQITLYQAWNLGWEAASAPIVCISNMDDAMHPQLLERVIDGMARNTWDVATVLIAKQVVDGESDCWDHQRLHRLELSTRPGPFFAWRTELKKSLGMFDESLVLVGDKDFWSRVVAQGLNVGVLAKILYLYTKHPDQLSKRGEFRKLKQLDRDSCKVKSYPHLWPAYYTRKVRWIRWFRKLPFCGRRFLAER